MATLLEMKQKSTREYKRIMEAWLEGKTILSRRFMGDGRWVETRYPAWNFSDFEYKILGEELADNDDEEEDARVA